MVEQRVHTVAEKEWEQHPAKILECKLGGRGMEWMGGEVWRVGAVYRGRGERCRRGGDVEGGKGVGGQEKCEGAVGGERYSGRGEVQREER